jgi:hypothetical protein
MKVITTPFAGVFTDDNPRQPGARHRRCCEEFA